jgi:mismatch-specific thymine-DNA glycosylase
MEIRVAIIRLLKGNQQIIIVRGQEILTLRDMLPPTPGLRVLFVGKAPAPNSIEIGHYFQGTMGEMFWSILKRCKLLKSTNGFEDDSLLAQGYGMTDVVKVPHAFKDEPSDDEYREGSVHVLELLRTYRPRVLVFVYKKALDKMSRLQFGIEQKSTYGFNDSLEAHFGARVFAFPLPGVPCNKADAKTAIEDLVNECK